MNTQCKLLCLPPEIRQRIYEVHFENTVISIHPATVVIESARAQKMHPLSSSYTGRQNKHLALFQVCRQMHVEAEAVFYRTVKFHIDIMIARPFVPTANLYRMRRLMGGAELKQLLELDEYRHSLRKKHSIIGPFDPERMQVRELDLAPWISSPVLDFMVDEANREVLRPISLDMYLSVYNQWVY